jgi:Protein of unknown function (DUF2488)
MRGTAQKMPVSTYYFVVASKQFMTVEEPLAEVLLERTRNYQTRQKTIDFWQRENPRFLDDPQVKALTKDCPRPALAVVSTDQNFILWLKTRLEYVICGKLESAQVPE